MRRIVAVIGTDGSGKTTLCAAATELLEANFRTTNVWLGAESELMAPIRGALKRLWRSGRSLARSGQTDTYAFEVERKRWLVTRARAAVRPYVWLVMADYRLQLARKLRRHRTAELLVADRYIFDVAVNLGITLGWAPTTVVAFVQRRLAEVPLPLVGFFVRVEVAVSMSRKDDIADPKYLEMRLEYYEAIAEAFGFRTLDGTAPIKQNAAEIRDSVVAEFSKPYVHYVHANNTDVGGADRVLANMVRNVRDHETRPRRVCVSLRVRTRIIERYVAEGIPVITRRFARPQLSGGARTVASFALRAPLDLLYFSRLFARERPGVVHVNDLYDFVPAIAARIHSIPVIYHLRMIRDQPLQARLFSYLVSRLSSVSISVSDAVRDHYFSSTEPMHRAEVIYDLANDDLRETSRGGGTSGPRPRPLPQRGRLVVMVGRVEEWKGQHVFLDAIERLESELRSRHVFALAGGAVDNNEDYLSRIVRDAARLGVFVLGDREDIPSLLQAADISVHCSIKPDPFPGVVIESMLAGAATIASAAGGVREIVSTARAGMLIEPGDSAALAEALTDLLASPDTPRARFSRVARETALALTDPSRINAELDAVYRSVERSEVGRR